MPSCIEWLFFQHPHAITHQIVHFYAIVDLNCSGYGREQRFSHTYPKRHYCSLQEP